MIAGDGVMTDQYTAVSVQKDLEDLIPAYMANRAKEIATLRALLAVGDYEQLGRVGHRMRGVGEPYGFDKVSALGKLIQDRAETRDHVGLEKCIDEYADYLARVQIVYR
jgi:HPt (histidine-containing phosphotransfer) domain-containing protein